MDVRTIVLMRGNGRQFKHLIRDENMSNRINLAKSWISAQRIGADHIGYDKFSWAVDELINMVGDNHEELWLIILEILNLDDSEEIIKAVGAGPLEDLMIYHGEKYIEKVEAEFYTSTVFEKAVRSVWLDKDDLPDAVYKRFCDIRENDGI